ASGRRSARARTPPGASSTRRCRARAASPRSRWQAARWRPGSARAARTRARATRRAPARATARAWRGGDDGYGGHCASGVSWRSSSGGRTGVGAVPAGRFDALQVALEEVGLAAVGVVDGAGRAADAVLAAGEYEQVEILACAHQRIDHLHGRGRVDVAVLLAEDQQQLALQQVRVVDAGGARVVVALAFGQAHPLFVPADLVHAVVVAAVPGHADAVEARMEQQRAERALPARRRAVDAHARDVVGRIARGQGAVPGDAVGEAGVAQVLP